MKTAVYAGTFDPPTNGHLWMLRQASNLFDKVVWAIGSNSDKKNKTMFSVKERLDMMREIARPFPNVEVAEFEDQFLVRYAKSIGANYIVRGVRDIKDFQGEQAMRNVNSDLEPNIATTFYMPPRELIEVSSGFVKGLVGPAGWERITGSYVPKEVFKYLLPLRHPLWEQLQKRGANNGYESQFWARVLYPYMEMGRGYHDWRHITDMITEFRQLEKPADDPLAMEMAIWYHDLIYNTKSTGSNEEASAEAAVNDCKLYGLPDDFSAKVSELILATKHKVTPTTWDTQLIVDLDLAPLGKPYEEFANDGLGIRKEYAHVPLIVYAEKRAEILQGFLDRPQIYNTDYFRNKYEKQARENLARAIAQLARS